MSGSIRYTDGQLADMLHRAHIRPSAARLAVLSRVVNGLGHPSADHIYASLSAQFPNLSRTTVYNTLHTLADAGLLRELDIEAGTCHYDVVPRCPHGHFICRICGLIFDMEIPPHISAAAGFVTEDVDVNFRGVCPDCNTVQPKDS